ncbi:MAG: hypothetical protein KDA45_14030, partial [Planctomycetales bacterium]|nr:hypothetical protein [Planctomycetales bacterium]
LQVARWIERSRPELGERLSTAVELASLSAEETRYGSRGFRESVLRHWQAAGFVPNWHQYLETRSLWNSLAAMLASALLLAGVALRWPDETQLAMQRMVLPWAAHHWPRNDQLAFRNPPQVVAWGSDLQLEVIDRKLPAPEPIDLHFRSADDTSSRSVTVIPTTMVSDIAVGNLPAVQQAIEVRAVGGDDDTMPWHRIDVVQPPKLNKYSFVITPPDYAGQEAQELVGHHIQVLAGSQVKFVGQFSEPIDQAVVELLPAPANVPPSVDALRSEGMPAVEEAAQPVQATEWLAMLEPDGRTLTIGSAEGQAITATQSLAWQLLISTRDGLHIHQPDSWSLEVVPDAPPVASLQAAELLQLSAQATLPLAGRATDDLGLTEVVARLQIDGAEDSEPRRYPLWTAGEPSAGQLPSREQVLQANWDLSTGPPLVTGQRISIWLEARDTSGQVGRSQSQSFEIRPSDELLLAIQERQNQILHRVRGLVDSQRRNAQLAARTRQRMQVEQRVDREETDVLMNIAQVQRAIGKQLSGDAASIAAELERLGTLLIQNRLHESELAGEMQRLRSQVEELAAQPMQLASSAAQQAASLAQRSVAEQRAWEADLESSLADSEQAQNRALGSLESLLDRLARTEALQQVQRELAQILSQQNALRRDTDQLQLQRLSAENSEEHRPRRAALSSDQQGLARRLEHLLSRAQELQAAAGNDQQALQGQIARATQTLVEEHTTANMRRSIEEIQSDRFAAATAT